MFFRACLGNTLSAFACGLSKWTQTLKVTRVHTHTRARTLFHDAHRLRAGLSAAVVPAGSLGSEIVRLLPESEGASLPGPRFPYGSQGACSHPHAQSCIRSDASICLHVKSWCKDPAKLQEPEESPSACESRLAALKAHSNTRQPQEHISI